MRSAPKSLENWCREFAPTVGISPLSLNGALREQIKSDARAYVMEEGDCQLNKQGLWVARLRLRIGNALAPTQDVVIAQESANHPTAQVPVSIKMGDQATVTLPIAPLQSNRAAIESILQHVPSITLKKVPPKKLKQWGIDLSMLQALLARAMQGCLTASLGEVQCEFKEQTGEGGGRSTAFLEFNVSLDGQSWVVFLKSEPHTRLTRAFTAERDGTFIFTANAPVIKGFKTDQAGAKHPKKPESQAQAPTIKSPKQYPYQTVETLINGLAQALDVPIPTLQALFEKPLASELLPAGGRNLNAIMRQGGGFSFQTYRLHNQMVCDITLGSNDTKRGIRMHITRNNFYVINEGVRQTGYNLAIEYGRFRTNQDVFLNAA
ncbi:hypothetical protein IPJ72_07360 [Candidatus Peregrinibacteria bacterium]|nr:MAG: hypothetical protein IPJ72_07360 [Candidatus Peregrinibacteria bacterium]